MKHRLFLNLENPLLCLAHVKMTWSKMLFPITKLILIWLMTLGRCIWNILLTTWQEPCKQFLKCNRSLVLKLVMISWFENQSTITFLSRKSQRWPNLSITFNASGKFMVVASILFGKTWWKGYHALALSHMEGKKLQLEFLQVKSPWLEVEFFYWWLWVELRWNIYKLSLSYWRIS
jgi:hypothetical protein